MDEKPDGKLGDEWNFGYAHELHNRDVFRPTACDGTKTVAALRAQAREPFNDLVYRRPVMDEKTA